MHIAAGLRANYRLRALDLSNNRLGDRGCEALAGMVRQTTSLQILFLSDNSIGDAGSWFLGSAFSVNSSLQMLDLDVNPISEVCHVTSPRSSSCLLPSTDTDSHFDQLYVFWYPELCFDDVLSSRPFDVCFSGGKEAPVCSV